MLSLDVAPSLAAVATPFLTVLCSDLGGPRRRQRLVLRGGRPPEWLCGAISDLPEGECVIVVAGGRLKAGSTIRVRSIVVFRERAGAPEAAYVYVEEWDCGARLTERATPFHVVRCAALPPDVRFVEVPHETRPPRRAALRSV